MTVRPSSKAAGELYNQYLSLPPHAREDFLRILQGTGAVKPAASPIYDAPRDATLLYDVLARKVYSDKGIRLPALAALKKTAAVAELEAVLRWLCGGKKVSPQSLAGVIDMATDAATHYINWKVEGPGGKEAVFQGIATKLARIPAAVDAAFPGYKASGFLVLVANSIGNGDLPKIPEAAHNED